ncbi:MAG TPA: pre-peptidase C-terminal domain-containing protein [Myxococcaceae bacterium]|nr:pre-peptidase C-terminal domain-containing protein [Myxococcaceae bacterium]
MHSTHLAGLIGSTRLKQLVSALAITSLLLLSTAQAGPLGTPFRVNTFTEGHQEVMDLAAGANGDTLVLWADSRHGGRSMQRYDSAGRKLQAEDWYVGTGVMAAALDRRGSFILVRTSADGDGNGIYATLYDRAGNLRVSEFRVNDWTAGDQYFPQVAMNANGDFAIAWTTNSNDAATVSVKRFRSDGTAVASQAVASDPAYLRPWATGIAIDALGNFAVTGVYYQSYSPNYRQLDIWMRRFNSAGYALGNAVRVNTHTPDIQNASQIAMSPQGDIIVTWESCFQGGPAWAVYAQRYNASGTPVGGEFLVNAPPTYELNETVPDVAVMDDGSFVIAWRHNQSARARQYRKDGTAVGPEFALDAGDPNTNVEFPKVGMDLAGNAMIAWRHFDYTTNQYDVIARRLVMDTLPPITPAGNGQTISSLSGAAGSWRYFKLTVPAGLTTLSVSISSPSTTGDADLYVRYAALPNAQYFDARPYLDGNNERAVIYNIPPGDWYIGINGYSSYSSVSLTATAY